MNGKIVDINVNKKEPTLAGTAICTCCQNEWVAVTPAGTTELKCPKCLTTKGVMKHQCEPANGVVWVCNCGNHLMYLTPTGFYCYNCGAVGEGF